MIAEIPYKSSDEGIVNISLSTKKLLLGLYTLSAELASDETQNARDSVLFTVAPVQASLALDSDTEMICDSKKFLLKKIQRLLDSNEIPIKISEEKLSDKKFNFTIHLSSEIFGSQDEIKKFKITSAYITFEKNGELVFQSDSKTAWGKLNRDLKQVCKKSAAEKYCFCI
ncbi:MAG: hypothetical protein L6V90_00855 [Treponema succinifaciens]|nr:MAG: hypothetical protein L6V90_00855 [Treponema succinifaciens]